MVGDDAQSIYGFRGGDPKFILRFEHDFSGAKLAPLPHSRRCHEDFMEPFFKVLEKYYPYWTGRPNLKYCKEKGDLCGGASYLADFRNQILGAFFPRKFRKQVQSGDYPGRWSLARSLLQGREAQINFHYLCELRGGWELLSPGSPKQG